MPFPQLNTRALRVMPGQSDCTPGYYNYEGLDAGPWVGCDPVSRRER
jgi:hypothetical protein